MKIRKVTALIDTTGPDISGEEIAMLANTSHLVFERDVPYFQAHPDAFTVGAAISTVEELAGVMGQSSASPAAAGSTISDATAMTADYNTVTGADGTKGVKLKTAASNAVQVVLNTGSNDLKVYPITGSQINGLGTGNPITLGPGQLGFFIGRSTILWYATATTNPSATELEALNGATSANATTGKVAILGTDGALHVADVLTTGYAVGTKNGGTVTVVEQGDGTIHKTILTLTGTPVTLTDDPGNGAYVGLKLYDFPAGNIVSIGASINADLTLSEAWWVDNIGGGVGVGSVATAVGTALTGTTQNIIASTAITAAAQVAPLDTQSTGVGISGAAGGTDADLTLNIRINDSALHFPDLVTNGAFTGNATGWTLGAGWAYGTNNVAATLADTAMTQTPASPTILAGVSYKLVFDVTASAGSVIASVGGTNGTARSTSATFTETIIAGAGGVLSFTGTGFSGTIDNVVLTPLTGTGAITGTVTAVWSNAGDF